jgi:hypothetical protein
MPRLGWLKWRRAPQIQEEKLLLGSLELISPTLLTGWVFHPRAELSEVRLLSGNRLIGAAPIDGDRPDVAAHLGRSGRFGFELHLRDDHPDPVAMEPLRMLAISADGSARFVLHLPGASTAATEARLRAALSPALRGLRGHFDGLSPGGQELQGWCYGHRGEVATVWLQAEGLPPRALRCTLHRPGMGAQGHVEDCGFSLPVVAWSEAAGRSVWASFDEAGELRLPQAAPLHLPLVEAEAPVSALPMAPQWQLEGGASATAPHEAGPLRVVVDNPALAELPVEFQAHWQALEDFRELIDRLDLQVQQAEQAAYTEPPLPSSPPVPLRSRSARFRLWR